MWEKRKEGLRTKKKEANVPEGEMIKLKADEIVKKKGIKKTEERAKAVPKKEHEKSVRKRKFGGRCK